MKIAISGYYGYGNLGDEAVLEATRLGLRKYFPEASLTVLSSKNHNPFNLVNEIRSADLLLSGGGSLFQDATSSRSFFYYIGIIFLAKLFRKRVVVFAQGFGPLKKKLNQTIARIILDQVDLILLRDEGSKERLIKIGITKPPTRVTGDAAGLLKCRNKETGSGILKLEGIGLNRPIVGVALRKAANPKVMARQLDILAEKYKLLTVFLLFQPAVDTEPAVEVAELMKKKSAVVFRHCAPQEMLSLYGCFNYFIGMRLHSLIFAALAGVPMVGVSYDPKVSAFMDWLGQPFIDLSNPSNLALKFDQVVKDKEQIKDILTEKSKEMAEKAELNFKYLGG
ncbi:MAG: polysaccharide pyruvyl transferase CsaB [bacterium]